jgi:hypothetical protein
MVALADRFMIVDGDERFEMLIEIFVGGLARRATASAPDQPRTLG